MLRPLELRLGEALRLHPAKFDYRWTPEAKEDLLELLFRSIAGWNDEHFRTLFPDGRPDAGWSLASQQGTQDGFEYTEAARGKRCGHIFAAGETTYHCATCTIDENCVLCSRCFEASDHTGHRYSITISMGANGCCDCGDEEAFKIPFLCGIHTALDKDEPRRKESDIPLEFQHNIRQTIAKVLDYFCDVISCAPEQLRLPQTLGGLRKDEVDSRLFAEAYGGPDLVDAESPEYAISVWNDEKHTIDQVTQQVARACRERTRYGLQKAHETDEVGRAVVKYGRDLQTLIHVTNVIEQIKLPVTIRTARDTYREMMCGAIVEWLRDIAGCSVGSDCTLLQHSICEELLQPWHVGSPAWNAGVGLQGLYDYDKEERDLLRSRYAPPFLFNVISREEAELDNEEEGNGEGEDNEVDDEGADEVVEEIFMAPRGGNGEDTDPNELNAPVMDLEEILAVVAQGLRPPLADGSDDGGGDARDEGHNDTADTHMRDGDDSEAVHDSPRPAAQGRQGVDETMDTSEHGTGATQDMAQPPMRPAQPASSSTPGGATNQPVEPTDTTAERPDQQTGRVPIPPTPGVTQLEVKVPSHWEQQPPSEHQSRDIQPYEDMRWRTRLDWMILFDLRLWKTCRHKIRDLCLATVVNVPQFKRILGLRFAALYPALAQLYLIADREPECSVVNLSVQLLSTPSITEEVIQRGNFLTTLFAILYSFLTSRQVGEPQDVNVKASLMFDGAALTPRRLQHYFSDLKFVLTSSAQVKQWVRDEGRYLHQFLDLVKLTQGLSPSERVLGQHIEYETESWIGSSILMREINHLCRMFCDCFRACGNEVPPSARNALAGVAAAAMFNSIGLEKDRFDQAEVKALVKFKTIPFGEIERDDNAGPGGYKVVDCVVEKASLSFYHPIHYMLSQLVEACRTLSQAESQSRFMQAAASVKASYEERTGASDLSEEDIAFAMFDYPLRVTAWCSQIKAGAWVRNGLSLRHQMSHYRSTVSRDLAFYRDIFLLQTAAVILDPARFLASVADRYGICDWIHSKYKTTDDIDEAQRVDIAADFIHLLVIILSDRSSLTFGQDEADAEKAVLRREIAHILCYKPLSFNELGARLHDRYIDSEYFDETLEEVADFRPPEGISDTGIYELKKDYIALIDPYGAHCTKNSRDDAEKIYCDWKAKKTGKKPSDVVFIPEPSPIPIGAFTQLSALTKTLLFTQLVHSLLEYCLIFCDATPSVSMPRVEGLLRILLHLMVLATLDEDAGDESATSFSQHCLCKRQETSFGEITVVGLLVKLSAVAEYQSCLPHIQYLVSKFRSVAPDAYAKATEGLSFPFETAETTPSLSASDKEMKKKQALERQAKVMAQFQQQQQNFMSAQGGIDWGLDESDEELEEQTTATPTTAWQFPAGNCILCQEDTGDGQLYGTFAMLANSKMLRKTVPNDRDFLREVLTTPANLDHSAQDIRPFGVAGQNVEKVRKLDPSGGEIIAERRGISKGFPMNHTEEGPVTIGCGHIMHYACFEEYYTGIRRRHNHQIARNHPERLQYKEFVCPLCKALGNAFLPIVWKPREPARTGLLDPTSEIDHRLLQSLYREKSRFRGERLYTGSEPHTVSDFDEIFLEYGRSRLNPAIAPAAGDLDDAMADLQTSMTPFHLGQTISPWQDKFRELTLIYKRLRDTMRVNKLQSDFDDAISSLSSDLTRVDVLVRTLGLTISSVEISQRGVAATPGRNVIDTISEQNITLLRVLCETASSYMAVGGLHRRMGNPTIHELNTMHDTQLRQLFIGSPDMDQATARASDAQPLLSIDAFCFLADASLTIIPHFKLEFAHIMRLCYMAEILKCVLHVCLDPTIFLEEVEMSDVLQVQQPHQPSWAAKRDYSGFSPLEHAEPELRSILDLLCMVCADENIVAHSADATAFHLLLAAERDPIRVLRTFKKMIEAYATCFLRKTLILAHAAYGVEFAEVPAEYANLSELNRLTVLLHLPTMADVMSEMSSTDPTKVVPQLVKGWWRNHLIEVPYMTTDYLWLPHPAIPELIGLPEHYDVLLDECTRRRCPTTGKALHDPAICLFCGEILCSQASCCQRGALGGCNQHLTRCGGNIGLFINIRKCVVLLLHDRHGSFCTAPYLDDHGEPDRGLRHGRRLRLNQKRYDRLFRDVWLAHGIPSAISRRLEGDINPGGWESL
ncbi:hypothetical protein KEM52_000130 [Ascosphaera acerosa]|nr:hypothetical protein KEM52_000130 [Ascosphaera acerosa]